jgi:hypothetical protein
VNRERFELDGLGNIRATERDVFEDLPDIEEPDWRRFENSIAEGRIHETLEVWNQPSPPAEPDPWGPGSLQRQRRSHLRRRDREHAEPAG